MNIIEIGIVSSILMIMVYSGLFEVGGSLFIVRNGNFDNFMYFLGSNLYVVNFVVYFEFIRVVRCLDLYDEDMVILENLWMNLFLDNCDINNGMFFIYILFEIVEGKLLV